MPSPQCKKVIGCVALNVKAFWAALLHVKGKCHGCKALDVKSKRVISCTAPVSHPHLDLGGQIFNGKNRVERGVRQF